MKLLLVLSSDYFYLFGLVPVTIAVSPVLFDLIVLNFLRRTVAYAESVSNNIELYLAEVCIFSLMVSQVLMISTSSSKVSKVANQLEMLT
jgi:hypothetical protein